MSSGLPSGPNVRDASSSGDIEHGGSNNKACGSLLHSSDSHHASRDMPLYAWPLLIVSVTMISSAGPTFATLLDVPALTLPAWRTQCTSLLLLVPGTLQLFSLPPGERFEILYNLHKVVAVGLMLAFDFGFWIWGLHNTSLPHSLFITSAAPPVIAIGSLILRLPISAGELVGTALAVCGAAYLAFGGKNDGGATVFGDMLSVVAVLAYTMYFVLGRHVRSYVPVFTYMMVVTGSCAIFLSLGAVVFEGASLHRLDAGGLFGWMNPEYLKGVAWLAVGPGIVGHTGLNTLLRWMHPLQITLPQVIIPILGSILGWLMGVSALPSGAPTWGGGVLLVIATVMVLTAAHKRQCRQNAIERDVELPEVQVVFSKQEFGKERTKDSSDDGGSLGAEAGDEPHGDVGMVAGVSNAHKQQGQLDQDTGEHARGLNFESEGQHQGQRSGLGRLRRWVWSFAGRSEATERLRDFEDDQEGLALLTSSPQQPRSFGTAPQ